MPHRIVSGPIANALLPPSMMPKIQRVNTGYLYSCRLLPSNLAVGDYDWFVTPQGQAGQGFTGVLTDIDTNLVNAQRVPDQTRYEITELGFYVVGLNEAGSYSGSSLNDLQNILGYSNLKFKKVEYEYTLGPTFLWPGGAGVYGAVAAASGTVITQAWNNGLPSPQARMKLKIPIILDPGDTFSMRLTVTTAVTIDDPTRAWLVMKGNTQSVIAR